MNTTDILIVLGVIFFTILGVRDGFLKKLFGILGAFGGLILATNYMTLLGDIFIDSIGLSKEVALIFSFFTIFIVAIIIVNLFYRWFGASGHDAIKPWERILGGILGTAQGIFALSLALVMLNFYDTPSEEEKIDSLLYEETVQFAPMIYDYTTRWIPDSKQFFEKIGQKFEHVKKTK